MGTQRLRPKFWLGLAVVLVCVIVGVVIGGFAGLALAIWLFEGGNVVGELLKPGPGKITASRILGMAIGAGIVGRVAHRLSVGLMRTLGLT